MPSPAGCSRPCSRRPLEFARRNDHFHCRALTAAHQSSTRTFIVKFGTTHAPFDTAIGTQADHSQLRPHRTAKCRAYRPATRDGPTSAISTTYRRWNWTLSSNSLQSINTWSRTNAQRRRLGRSASAEAENEEVFSTAPGQRSVTPLCHFALRPSTGPAPMRHIIPRGRGEAF